VLPRSILHVEHAHTIIFVRDFVVLRINFDRISRHRLGHTTALRRRQENANLR
jgi:hypothetical protein